MDKSESDREAIIRKYLELHKEDLDKLQPIDHDKEMGRPGLSELGNKPPYYRYYSNLKDISDEDQGNG